MSEDHGIHSFEEFWPFYVGEHANKTNRTLHFVGTTLSMLSVGAGILTRRKAFFAAAPLLGYGFAWVGHFLVEGNRPATFTYPAWSLRGDFVMWWKMVKGTMDAEVERCAAAQATAPAEASPTNGAGASAAGEPAADPTLN